MKKIVSPINPHDDGTCRCIKAQYYKTGVANFLRQNCWGGVGVSIEYDYGQ